MSLVLNFFFFTVAPYFLSMIYYLNELRSQGSFVSIVTRSYRIDIWVLIPSKDRDFFTSSPCTNQYWSPPSLLSNEY